MHRKPTIALAAATAIVGGLTLMPTEASAQCRWTNCTYYTSAWVPAYRPVQTTVAQPVLVRRPVTTYVYQWSSRPERYTYYAPTYRRAVVAWRPGMPPVVAMGR